MSPRSTRSPTFSRKQGRRFPQATRIRPRNSRRSSPSPAESAAAPDPGHRRTSSCTRSVPDPHTVYGIGPQECGHGRDRALLPQRIRRGSPQTNRSSNSSEYSAPDMNSPLAYRGRKPAPSPESPSLTPRGQRARARRPSAPRTTSRSRVGHSGGMERARKAP